jgi:hypothetical protein
MPGRREDEEGPYRRSPSPRTSEDRPDSARGWQSSSRESSSVSRASGASRDWTDRDDREPDRARGRSPRDDGFSRDDYDGSRQLDGGRRYPAWSDDERTERGGDRRSDGFDSRGFDSRRSPSTWNSPSRESHEYRSGSSGENDTIRRYGREGRERSFGGSQYGGASSWNGSQHGGQSSYGDVQGSDLQRASARSESFRGVGPKGYKRSDERIREDINDRLTDASDIDASAIECSVQNGEVTLTGTVPDRESKRNAEELVESISGVKEVQNNLRVKKDSSTERASGSLSSKESSSSSTSMPSSGANLTGSSSSSKNR